MYIENQALTYEVQKLHKILASQHNVLFTVIELLVNLSNAVNEGFEKVNDRLSVLEGKQGMQGVNTQLQDIKHELYKIQKAYPYNDMFNNLQSVQGAA